MANREGRFKKIRPRSTPNSTAQKHERCFQSKPHIYHPVLVCTFSQSWKTIRTKNCSHVFVRDLEQNFNIFIFKYISLITEHPTIFFKILSSSQCTMIWTAIATLQALHLHLHHFRPKTNSKYQALSDHIDYSWNNLLHSIFLFVQFFQFCFLTTRRCHVGENIW